MNLGGSDYGEKQACRVCKNDSFEVERGRASVNDEGVTTLVIRCWRCGTVYDILQVDWKGTPGPDDHVVIEDGIEREPGFVR